MVAEPFHWYVTSDLALAESVAAAIAPLGVSVQLRASAGASELAELAGKLRALTRAAGVRFLVNRREELARSVDADGLHTDVSSIAAVRARWPEAFLSAPCHDDDDVRRAVAAGANMVLVSPIFATPGKGTPRGVAALASACAIAEPEGVRVVALGGVTLETAELCREHGAAGIAAIRLFEAARDPAAVARALGRSA